MIGLDLEKCKKRNSDDYRLYADYGEPWPIGYTIEGTQGRLYLCGECATKDQCSDAYVFEHDAPPSCQKCGEKLNEK